MLLPPSFRLKGDKKRVFSLMAQARQLYNFIASQAEAGGVDALSKDMTLEDGSTISVRTNKTSIYGHRVGTISIFGAGKTTSVEKLPFIFLTTDLNRRGPTSTPSALPNYPYYYYYGQSDSQMSMIGYGKYSPLMEIAENIDRYSISFNGGPPQKTSYITDADGDFTIQWDNTNIVDHEHSAWFGIINNKHTTYGKTTDEWYEYYTGKQNTNKYLEVYFDSYGSPTATFGFYKDSKLLTTVTITPEVPDYLGDWATPVIVKQKGDPIFGELPDAPHKGYFTFEGSYSKGKSS